MEGVIYLIMVDLRHEGLKSDDLLNLFVDKL
ncbi:hypothetical protein M2408_001036 [Sphingobacterium sp. BIGb0165]|nr:hypothetical protein [Sphingobacterium sp. BIGb0165]